MPRNIQQRQIVEDNIYNHMSFYTQNNFSYAGYDFDAARDPFEWQLSSTKQVARAFLFDQKYVLETRLEWLTPPPSMGFLKANNIQSVLRITITQLYADMKYMRPISGSVSFSPVSDDNIASTMVKLFLSYEKIWGRGHFQIVMLSADFKQREGFIQKVSQKLEQVPGLSISKKLSLSFLSHSPNKMYVILKNSYGKSLIEDTQMSSAFSAVPADSKHNWKTDGERINQDAKDNLISMGIISNLDKE